MPAATLSRRTALLRALLFAGLSAAGLAHEAEAKVTQKAAGYQDHPKQGHQCSGCSHFHAPDSCDLVAGKISPNGWCRFFSPKITSY